MSVATMSWTNDNYNSVAFDLVNKLDLADSTDSIFGSIPSQGIVIEYLEFNKTT